MTMWRYTAIRMDDVAAARRQGELAGETAAEVRAALRRIGLQVIDLRPMRRSLARTLPGKLPGEMGRWAGSRGLALRTLSVLRHRGLSYLRGRGGRREERADLYDSLATMLESGLPLLEAVDTLAQSSDRRRAMRDMLLHVREALRSGDALATVMRRHEGWFDAVEVAMVEAAQHGGTLPEVLRTLSARQEESTALTQKLAGALAYPAIVTLVGLGVVIFLSVKTLPNLTQILIDSGVEPPALTKHVMAIGQFLASSWLWIGAGAVLLQLVLVVLSELLPQLGYATPRVFRRFRPRVLRRMAVAGAVTRLAELIRTGVPMVDALRVVAPVTPGSPTRGLRGALTTAADRVEHGDDLAAALDDELYFDAEFRRLLTIGQSTGELDALLDRLGRRYERQARRLIDRLTTLLEPGVILALAVLVGVVVMAAVLPLLRLQEVL